MKNVIVFLLILLMASSSCFAASEADLIKFVKDKKLKKAIQENRVQLRKGRYYRDMS